MALTEYKSTDASSPTLNGTAGSFITVLDAILVNGYGAKAAAGWAKEFSGTNKAVYRAATGNRHRLRIDDSNTQESRLVGYTGMTDVDTGTGPFPTAAQVSGGLFNRKSNTADATARPWYCLADSTFFYFISYTAQTIYGNTASTDSGMFFGDFPSFLTGDAFNTLLLASATTGANTSRLGSSTLMPNGGGDINNTLGHYVALPYTQAGSAIQVCKNARWPMGSNAGAVGDSGHDSTYPDPISGGLLLAEIDIWETTSAGFSSRRGTMPSMYATLHNQAAVTEDTFSGTGSLIGTNFVLKTVYSGATAGRAAFEVP